MYRPSDANCSTPDAAPLPERTVLFKEKWDCLSKEATKQVRTLYIKIQIYCRLLNVIYGWIIFVPWRSPRYTCKSFYIQNNNRSSKRQKMRGRGLTAKKWEEEVWQQRNERKRFDSKEMSYFVSKMKYIHEFELEQFEEEKKV